MGSLEKRIEELERLIGTPEDEEAKRRKAIMVATLDEIGALKACRARNSYRGGIHIQPTDPAGEALGYPYTRGQLFEYAVRRVFEREGAPNVGEDLEELIEGWTDFWRRISEERGREWDEVEAEGPPERAEPYR